MKIVEKHIFELHFKKGDKCICCTKKFESDEIIKHTFQNNEDLEEFSETIKEIITKNKPL